MGLFSKLKSPMQSFQSSPPGYSSNTPNSNYAPPSPPRQPINPDPRILPSGWISQFDPNSQKFFYVYTPTGLRQWEHPADKPINGNRGENSSYQQPQQQPYYGQPQQQRFSQQPAYGQPQYAQQPAYAQQSMGGSRLGGGAGGMGLGTMAAVGVGGGLMGYMIGDAIGDSHQPDIIENNYYDNDNNYDGGGGGGGFNGGGGGGFDGGGGGGFDGGMDDGGFDMF